MFRRARPALLEPAVPQPALPQPAVPQPALLLAAQAPPGQAGRGDKPGQLRTAAADRVLEMSTVRSARCAATCKAAFASSASLTVIAACLACRDVTRHFIAAWNAAPIKTAKLASSAIPRFGGVPKPA